MQNRGTFAALFLLVAGCSSSDSNKKPLPTAAQIQAFTRATNLFLVPVEISGTTGLLGVDTGDPFLLLNPATFPLAPATGTETLTIATQDYPNIPVITSSLSPTSPDSDVPIGGLIGCPILCNTVSSFNYRDTVFTIGSTPTLDGLLPEIKLPFAFEGGGSVVQVNNTNITLPKSRIVVDVLIEGISYRMLVDTGASDVTVDADTYAALTADGRVQLFSGGVETTAGASSASYTRAKTVSLGGASASGVIVVHDDSFDNNLASLSTDAGETVHGSLGGSFLSHFNLTIDYPSSELHLAPYQDTSFIFDGAQILGCGVDTALSTGWAVGNVFGGSDAEMKGVVPGDVITSIDGTSIAGLTITQVQVLLGGKVGAMKSVQFGSAKNLANQTVQIMVEDFLPLL
ncbi:MAG: aspartyl protease family protein [Polyangiaceae bacterium]